MPRRANGELSIRSPVSLERLRVMHGYIASFKVEVSSFNAARVPRRADGDPRVSWTRPWYSAAGWLVARIVMDQYLEMLMT